LKTGFYYLLWDVFQYGIGGNVDKQNLCLDLARSGKSILEVGCATGNIAEIFKDHRDKRYVGIDIDGLAIERATKKNLPENIKFYNISLSDFVLNSSKFDTILLAGFFHHIPDALCVEMLKDAVKILESGGKIYVVDPLRPGSKSPLLYHFYSNFLEKGQYLREKEKLVSLVESVDGIQIDRVFQTEIGATPFGRPLCAHFCIAEISKSSSNG